MKYRVIVVALLVALTACDKKNEHRLVIEDQPKGRLGTDLSGEPPVPAGRLPGPKTAAGRAAPFEDEFENDAARGTFKAEVKDHLESLSKEVGQLSDRLDSLPNDSAKEGLAAASRNISARIISAEDNLMVLKTNPQIAWNLARSEAERTLSEIDTQVSDLRNKVDQLGK